MTSTALPLSFDRARLVEFCETRGIRRLSVFGSVLRPDFNESRSDIDVLAEFRLGALEGVGLRYFDYAPELAGIFGHPVDFCSRLDPLLRERIEASAVPLYEQP